MGMRDVVFTVSSWDVIFWGVCSLLMLLSISALGLPLFDIICGSIFVLVWCVSRRVVD